MIINNNHRIQVFRHELFSYSFGHHGTEPGNFNSPCDLTLNNNHRIQVFTVSGNFIKVFGNFTGVPFKLQEPVGIYYTPDNFFC